LTVICDRVRLDLLRAQSISGTGTPRMGEADAIGSPIIQESKAEERRRERQWFTDGFI